MKDFGKQLFYICFSVLCFTFSFGLNYLHSNSYSAYRPEALLFLLVICVFLLLIAIPLQLVQLGWMFYVLLFVLAIDLTFGTGSFFLTRFKVSGSSRILALAICYGSQISIFSFFVFLMRRHVHLLGAVVFGGMFVSTVLLLPFRHSSFYVTKMAAVAVKPNNSLKNNIVVLILDEHIGVEGIPENIEGAQALKKKLKDLYTRRQFKLFVRAYTNYSNTMESLPSLLNLQVTSTPAKFPLSESRLLEHFANQGYRINVYQNTYVNLSAIKSLPLTKTFTYPMNSPAFVMRLNVPLAGKLWVLLDGFTQVYRSEILKNLEFKVATNLYDVKLAALATDRVLAELESDLKQNRNGNVFFAHLLMPHRSYVYDSECGLNDWTSWENRLISFTDARSSKTRERKYKLYLGQVNCLHNKLSGLFDFMEKEGLYDSATIVMTGDHGSRIINNSSDALTPRDLLDLHSTFLAIKSPVVADTPETYKEEHSNEPIPVISVLSDFFQIPLKLERPDAFKLIYRKVANGYQGKQMVNFPGSR